MMKKLNIILLIILSCSIVYAQNPNLGSSGAQFLEIPVGAKPAALAGAYMGLSDDAVSTFWNPAGLSGVKSNEAHFSYMRWFEQFDFNAFSAAFNLEGIGVVGVQAILFTMDDLEITTEQEPNGTGRFFGAQDIAIGVSYARYFTDRFAFGITAKYIEQSIWNESSSGLAFDLGTKYTLDFQNLTIAMSMRNFGADLKFDGDDLIVVHDLSDDLPQNRLTNARLETSGYQLPLSFQVGVGIDLFTSDYISVRSGIDAVHPNDNQERVHFGTEVSIYNRIFLRGGYKYNYDDEDFTFGAGVDIPLQDASFKFDYAYSVYDILPSIHRISLGIKF
jgi:hypothetical protein